MDGQIREFLSGHEVSTAYELGWSTLRNGELLTMAEASGAVDNLALAMRPVNRARAPVFALLVVSFGNQ